jgi:hypothetical protein
MGGLDENLSRPVGFRHLVHTWASCRLAAFQTMQSDYSRGPREPACESNASGKVTICVEPIMSSLLKCLIAAAASVILAGAATTTDAVAPGFMEGHLKIVFLGAVEPSEPSDTMPRQTVTAERYAEYPLIVLNQDG